jgi:hypothetical protein
MSGLLDLRGLNNYLTTKLPIYIDYRNLLSSDIVGFGNGFRRLDLESIPNMRFVKPISIKIGLAIGFAEEKPNDMLYQDGFYHTFLISIDPSTSKLDRACERYGVENNLNNPHCVWRSVWGADVHRANDSDYWQYS